MIKIPVPVFSIAVMFLASCGNAHDFGERFEPGNAIAIDKAINDFKEKGIKETTVEGEIAAVCQTEGCWFNYKTRDGEQLVDFDHKFEIPKTSAGKIAVSKGYFYYDTTSVEKLQEYAKDDGKSEAEIAAIISPEVQLIFIAKGVHLK
jgi:hypothetical protein